MAGCGKVLFKYNYELCVSTTWFLTASRSVFSIKEHKSLMGAGGLTLLQAVSGRSKIKAQVLDLHKLQVCSQLYSQKWRKIINERNIAVKRKAK